MRSSALPLGHAILRRIGMPARVYRFAVQRVVLPVSDDESLCKATNSCIDSAHRVSYLREERVMYQNVPVCPTCKAALVAMWERDHNASGRAVNVLICPNGHMKQERPVALGGRGI